MFNCCLKSRKLTRLLGISRVSSIVSMSPFLSFPCISVAGPRMKERETRKCVLSLTRRPFLWTDVHFSAILFKYSRCRGTVFTRHRAQMKDILEGCSWVSSPVVPQRSLLTPHSSLLVPRSYKSLGTACKMFYENTFRFAEPENINKRRGIYPLILCISILKLIWTVFSMIIISPLQQSQLLKCLNKDIDLQQ